MVFFLCRLDETHGWGKSRLSFAIHSNGNGGLDIYPIFFYRFYYIDHGAASLEQGVYDGKFFYDVGNSFIFIFTAICGACHAMYGQGGKIGPDLTGSGRANLDYLLENIADPSGVVSADFRMSLLTHKDGRGLSGVVTESNARTLTLRTMTETLTLDRSDIVKQETSPLSMMPEGLLLAFQPEQVRDLIAYLMHPVQVPLPKAP